MPTLNLVTSPIEVSKAKWIHLKDRLVLIHGLRAGLLVTIFFIAIMFQMFQGSFLSPAIWIPVYGVLIGLFSINGFYFLFSDWCEEKKWIHGGLFGMDALAITMLLYQTGAIQSIFFFLYLVDIILCGLLFQNRGAFTQALWTSLLFNILLLFTLQVHRESLYFLATLNNVAFFSVAFLSGHLGEQMNVVGAELKRTVRSLELLQDLNKLIIENIGSGMITVDLEGQIVIANPAASRILDHMDLVNHDIHSFFPGLNLVSNVVWLHGQTQDVRRIELEFVNRSREKLQIEVLISWLKDEQGQPHGYILIFQDRTELRRLELAIRQKEKLAAVGQLAAGIAHEIRNPLASLSGSVQLMASQPEKYSQEDIKLMRIINREIDRLNALVTEFLDYVRPESMPDHFLNINVVLKDVMEMIQFDEKLRQKNIDHQILFKSKCEIKGHADKLKQAFLNMIMNAYQAIEKKEGGEIKVETFDVQDRVVVRIQDNGVGMNEETKTRLFEPFFTTKPKGTGLGLAVTHKILESHQARVQVSSSQGEGTVFTIDFPAHRDHYNPFHSRVQGA